jgi:tetratricopeptide (TPR) repeat protein
MLILIWSAFIAAILPAVISLLSHCDASGKISKMAERSIKGSTSIWLHVSSRGKTVNFKKAAASNSVLTLALTPLIITSSTMRCTNRLVLIVVITLASAAVFVSGEQQVPLRENAASGDAVKQSAADYLKQGSKAMALGKFADAISHFDDAILADPDNYLSYYRRATASLSLGRSGSAIADFDKINLMNPKFPQAHLQKAKLLIKDGRLDKARESRDHYMMLKKTDDEGKELKKTIDSAASNLKTLQKTKQSIDKSLQSGKNITTDKSLPSKVDECMKLASLILEVSPSSLEARRDRADCALAKGEYEDAIADWT